MGAHISVPDGKWHIHKCAGARKPERGGPNALMAAPSQPNDPALVLTMLKEREQLERRRAVEVLTEAGHDLPPTAPAPLDHWSCDKCVFSNPYNRNLCIKCGAQRPPLLWQQLQHKAEEVERTKEHHEMMQRNGLLRVKLLRASNIPVGESKAMLYTVLKFQGDEFVSDLAECVPNKDAVWMRNADPFNVQALEGAKLRAEVYAWDMRLETASMLAVGEVRLDSQHLSLGDAEVKSISVPLKKPIDNGNRYERLYLAGREATLSLLIQFRPAAESAQRPQPTASKQPPAQPSPPPIVQHQQSLNSQDDPTPGQKQLQFDSSAGGASAPPAAQSARGPKSALSNRQQPSLEMKLKVTLKKAEDLISLYSGSLRDVTTTPYAVISLVGLPDELRLHGPQTLQSLALARTLSPQWDVYLGQLLLSDFYHERLRVEIHDAIWPTHTLLGYTEIPLAHRRLRLDEGVPRFITVPLENRRGTVSLVLQLTV